MLSMMARTERGWDVPWGTAQGRARGYAPASAAGDDAAYGLVRLERGKRGRITRDAPPDGPLARRGKCGRTLLRQLVRQNFELVDLGCFGEQVAGLDFLHQGRRHLAVEMRIAPGLVVERVKDGEGGWPLLNREP